MKVMFQVCGVILPFCVLAFCNTRLVRTLNESISVRKSFRVTVRHVEANHRITTILVTIVIMVIKPVPTRSKPDRTGLNLA